MPINHYLGLERIQQVFSDKLATETILSTAQLNKSQGLQCAEKFVKP